MEAVDGPPVIERKPGATAEIGLSLFGALTLVVHKFSPAGVILILLALICWAKRSPLHKTWYGTFGLILTFVAIGADLLYLATYLLGSGLK